jgi:peroxiredoxin
MENTIAVRDTGASERTALSRQAKLGIAVVAILTILLTWRARVLETSLQEQSERPALVSKPAPDFSAVTPDGRTVSLADFRGRKKVVVSFWASWCAPCRTEMPALVKFYQAHHTTSSDFELLAVSIDADPKDATTFATAAKLNFPVLLDPNHKVADAFQVDGIPTMFIIDRNGKITYGHLGYDMTMEFRLSQQLGLPAKPAGPGAE